MGNLMDHAKRELDLLGYTEGCEPPNSWMRDSVLELIETFSKQGHSGFSAPCCIQLFEKIARFLPVKPLTGEDEEWTDLSEEWGGPRWQNKRCSRVFKDADGACYDIEGKVFRDPEGFCYTSKDSNTPVEFPYIPTTEYVDVTEQED